jgi:phosphatidylglycerophosphate synthase
MIHPWWQLPPSPLRSSVIRAVALGAALTIGLALWLRATADSGSFIFVSLSVFGAVTLFALGRVGAYHPFPRFGAANSITLIRVSLLAILTGLVAGRHSDGVAWTAVGMTVLLVLLDGLDGLAARREALASPFGARFDMETDAMVILVLSLLVWRHDKAGVWVVACGLMRYAFVASRVALPWMAAPLRSTFRGKSVAVVQLVGLGLALCPLVPRPVSTTVASVTLAALVWSFALDVGWLWRSRLTSPT